MFRKFIGTLALCLSFMLIANQAYAERIRVGSWKGGSYNSKKTGQFSHCVVSAKYKRGDRLLLSINRKYVFSLGIADDRWNMKRRNKYTVRLQVDRKAVFKRTGIAVSSRQLVIPINDRATFFRMVKGGSKLWIETNGLNRGYNLRGTSRALNATLRCVKRQLRYANNFDQPRRVDEPRPDTRYGSGETRTKPNRYVNLPSKNTQRKTQPVTRKRFAVSSEKALIYSINLLSDAGISGYKILEKSSLKKAGYQAVWSYSKGKIGALATFKSRRKDFVDTQTAKILGDDAKSCKGKFASGFRKSDTSKNWSGRRLFTICSSSSNGNDFTIHYSIGLQPNGRATIVATLVNGDGLDNAENDDSEAIDQAIYKSRTFRNLGR